MARHPLTVGARRFASKSEALGFYKAILNAYPAGGRLNTADHASVVDLAYMDFTPEEVAAYEAETGDCIRSVVVDFHPEFPRTKCFFLVDASDATQPFSYRLAINGALSDGQVFSRACRHAVEERLRDFKKQQFRARPVRCALSGRVVEWEQCHVDHKAPLTFSVIVRSFVVANGIDTGSVGYSGGAKEEFADRDLAARFEAFHREMAVLRIVSADQNARLASGARIKPTSKDGTLRQV